jgi:hypothetical protein
MSPDISIASVETWQKGGHKLVMDFAGFEEIRAYLEECIFRLGITAFQVSRRTLINFMLTDRLLMLKASSHSRDLISLF